MEKMDYVLIVPVLVFIIGALLADYSSAEILVINDTKQAFYAVTEIQLKGDLDTNKLVISGFGKVISGENARVYLVGGPTDVLIENMKVNGRAVPVSFDERGYFMVLDEGDFVFQGDMAIRTVGQVRLFVPGPVNSMKFDLKHGYAIHGDQFGLFGSEVIIQRSEKVAMLVEAALKYSFAQRREFTYRISYKSFGSSLGQASMSLKNGENIVNVDGAKVYAVKDGNLILELEGNQATVQVTGTFDTDNIIVPIEGGRHHVLLESDPQTKLTATTSAQEIDLGESAIAPSFSNARAYLASSDTPISVSVIKLKMFPSLGASARQATNRIAITQKGSMLAELTYDYSNTGEDYLAIDAPGTPLYAGTGYRDSVKLTKDAGKLFLSFPKTQRGTLDMIYFDTRAPLRPIDYLDLPIANSNIPITDFNTQVILPEDYFVIWTFGAEGGSELPSFESLLLFGCLLGGLGYALNRRVDFAFLFAVFSAGLYLFSPTMLVLFIIMALVVVMKRNFDASMKWLLIAGVVAIITVLLGVAFLGVFGMMSKENSLSKPMTLDADYANIQEMPASKAMEKSMEVLGSGEGAINVPVREGILPVRFELPALGKSITMKSHLINKDEPLRVGVLIASTWLKFLAYAISLVAGVLCTRMPRH